MARRLLKATSAMQQNPENPYGLQRPPYPPAPPPPGYTQQPPPVLPVLQPQSAAAIDERARTWAIVLAVSAVAMLIGLLSYSWFTHRESGVGLMGVKDCFEGHCQSMGWSDIKRTPTDIQLFGYLGMLGIIGSIIMCIHSAAMLMNGGPSRVKIMPTNIVLGVTAFATVSFWMRLAMGEMGKKLSVGWTGFVCIAGVLAAGIVIHNFVRKAVKS